ncbi:RNA polymerase sigma factor [Neolewinella antarctica]|uniref:RNA polymerase sigma-70 factor (ECF subfamily) n=1 Tax=Neolewinella antarctica TaxID=442734 RepID=A0ABX0XBQ3_9BACT|nr:RNA polymerase sigma factor [Neolewinella antarctica]NJC26700.1 RNA polymerase sigma-70 factor (ECF subfamily) [Neolewinella antarctica]
MPANLDEHLPSILDGCLTGRRASQHELYKLYYGYGMSVAIRYVNDESEAISIVNDAFMKVYKSLKTFDRSQAYKPWFRRVVVNTAINQLKRQQKYQLETGMDETGDIADRENILSQINYRELVALVQSLSTAYRAVFNMYVIDGFPHDEIAKTLGISVSTSKSNLVRARRKLRELLREQLSINNA